MNITFEWMLADGQSLPEADLSGQIETLRAQAAAGQTEGTLLITDEGIPPVQIQDTLGAIVVGLCLEAMTQLIVGQSATVELYSTEGSLTFSVDGNDITLPNGDWTARYGRGEFIPAALDCADRFIAFYRLLYAGDAGWLEEIKTWETMAAANRAAWSGTTAPAPIT